MAATTADGQPAGTDLAVHWSDIDSSAYAMSLQRKQPQRRITDHFHPDVWSRDEQHRFEDGLEREMKEMRAEIRVLSNRLILVIGGLGLLAFVLPIAAPFIRGALGI